MSFLDMIRDSVVSEFTGVVSVGDILLSLGTSFLISLLIIFIYRKTYNGVVYSKSFSLSLIILAMVTSLIIRTISSNLALSLGMVGALSIVRFRTAVKEPVDTGFMFFAITAGIMAGAGLYLVAIIASVALCLLYFLSYMFGFKSFENYLLVVKYRVQANDLINKYLSDKKLKVKSKTITKDVVELTYEIDARNNLEIIDELNRIDGVIVASLISYQNDFGA